MRTSRRSHQRCSFWLELAAGLPGSSVALVILGTGDDTPEVQWRWTVFVATLGLPL